MNKWWGYLHTEGSIHAKRYFDEGDIEEARSSPFCKKIYGPFEAATSGDAIEMLFKHFRPETDVPED